MWHDLLDVLRSGTTLIEHSSSGVALLVAFALGFFFGAVPAGAAEILALTAGTVTQRTLVFPLLLLITAGHILGKLLWYWLGTFEDRMTNPRARAWIEKANELQARHPRLGFGVILSSSFASLPPFHLSTISAGVVRMPILSYTAAAFLGRLGRFALVAMVPGMMRYFF